MPNENNFGQDVDFISQHAETIVLGEENEGQICVVPAYQGRTMTSTTSGAQGNSFGWVGYDAISSKALDPQINLYGGEDRFWLSPEGGQYSVFFDPGVPLELKNWRTPAIIDTEPFDLVDQTDSSVTFTKQGSVKNFSSFVFDIQFDRTVELLPRLEIEEHIGCKLGEKLKVVGHQSRNVLSNIGLEPWQQATGLLGIWILCMNKPSDAATIVIPFQPGPDEELGRVVTANYFGELDSSRLKIDHEQSLIFFLGDGKLRSKLGLSFPRTRSTMGSWNNDTETLTITQFNLPQDPGVGYTNNLWEIQKAPYAGDVINSYNDGPSETGSIMGPFYELETISPALPLAPKNSYTHIHRTIHLEGPRPELNRICESVFGTGVDAIASQFG